MGSDNYAIYTSTYGNTWDLQTLPNDNGNGFDGVAYGNGIFIAFMKNSTGVSTSADGITWTLNYTYSPYEVSSVVYANGLF